MGLRMQDKRKVCQEIYKRYQKASKKERGKILEEYSKTLGYNRDYLAFLLSKWGKKIIIQENGTQIICGMTKSIRSEKKKLEENKSTKGRKPKYNTKDFVRLLIDIWELFDCLCGKLLAPLIRLMIDFLEKEFELDENARKLLSSISARTIDRLLKPEKDKTRLKGISLTKPGSLLRNQIPVRVMFDWDERKIGFFELDRVAHSGADASGQFCQTLTATDVGSGWTEEYALLNSAHRWVKERIEQFHSQLPFPLKGIDSDNGGEFINYQLKDWCDLNGIQFTRGRPYRKNDNCFVEQKNGDVVRKTVGYERFEGQEMCDTLNELYQSLNPLLNYWYPTMRLIAKEKQSNGRYKKIYEKEPKTPFQRILDSSEVSEACKEALRQKARELNPVALKRSMDQAREKLLNLARNQGKTVSSA